MNELKRTMDNIQELIDFAESKGWSEEELAKVVNLLHSELMHYSLSDGFSQSTTDL